MHQSPRPLACTKVKVTRRAQITFDLRLRFHVGCGCRMQRGGAWGCAAVGKSLAVGETKLRKARATLPLNSVGRRMGR
jgi:hypothetical protein